MTTTSDIAVEITGLVATIEIRRPPLNFFDILLIRQIADTLDEIDNDPNLRAVVLAAQGRSEEHTLNPVTREARMPSSD